MADEHELQDLTPITPEIRPSSPDQLQECLTLLLPPSTASSSSASLNTSPNEVLRQSSITEGPSNDSVLLWAAETGLPSSSEESGKHATSVDSLQQLLNIGYYTSESRLEAPNNDEDIDLGPQKKRLS